MASGALGSLNPIVTTADPATTDPGMAVRVIGGSGGAAAVDSATVTQVPVDMVAVTVLAANTARKGYRIQAGFENPNAVYFKEGSGAASNSRTGTLQPGGYTEPPPQVNYRGVVTAIGVAAGNVLDVTEY